MLLFADAGYVLMHIIVLFAVAMVIVRIMGNRTVGQLSPFDFIIMVGIGDIIIAASLDRNISLAQGAEGLVTLLALQQLLSYLSLKSPLLRKWFEGTPVTLIENGKILRNNFIKTYFNYDDLRQELHRQGLDMTDLNKIRLARLESCGAFTVILQPDDASLSKRQLAEFVQDIVSQPLTPLGQEWEKIEACMEDVRQLKELLAAGSAAVPAGRRPEMNHEDLH